MVGQGDVVGDVAVGRGEAPEDGEEGAADDAGEVGDDEEPLAAGEGRRGGGRGSFGKRPVDDGRRWKGRGGGNFGSETCHVGLILECASQ